jgi:hypothetical protein
LKKKAKKSMDTIETNLTNSQWHLIKFEKKEELFVINVTS